MTFTPQERKAYFQAKRQKAARAAGWRNVDQFLTAAGNGQVEFPPCPAGFVPVRAKYRRAKKRAKPQS